jgi:transcriptional regulator with XRE-family HTH domain
MLDRDRMISLRLAERMSQRDVARAARVTPILISNLEAGRIGSHAELSLAVLGRLAGALGVEPAVLLASSEAKEETPREPRQRQAEADGRRIGALLAQVGRMIHRADLLPVMRWSPARVDAAIRSFEASLAGTGQRLHKTWGIELRPERSQIDDGQLEAVERCALKRSPLHSGTAQLLYRVASGKVDSKFEAHASNPERVNLSRLVKLGLIRRGDQRLILRDEVAFSLGLEPGKNG